MKVESTAFKPRETCWRCRRPQCVCLCEVITVFRTDCQFVFLAHPREARSRTSSGYLTHLSLPNSLYIEDYDFQNSKELIRVLNDVSLLPVLLYPAPKSLPLEYFRVAAAAEAGLQKKLCLILIEGTWAQAKTIIAQSPSLQQLATAILPEGQSSRFKIRTQPREGCLSTMEAAAFALRLLGELSGHDAEVFLRPFLTLVDRQIQFQTRCNPRYRRKWELPAKATL